MSIAGKVFFILGPSGVGKGKTIELLREHHKEFTYPKSSTTRPMRENESEGNPYHFVSQEQFEKDIQENNFLEYARVHDMYYYGTPKKPIFDAMRSGKTVIKELDIQGYLQAREHFKKGEVIGLFLIPPSKETLMRRIQKRSKMSEHELGHRMESLEKELAQAKECELSLRLEEEDDIERQYKKVEKIILENM